MQEKWKNRLPKLYEIYSKSDQNNPNNYFKGMDRRLENKLALLKYEELEGCLCQLDSKGWQGFKPKTVGYVCSIDDLYGRRQLFDCFNEVKGYLHLKTKGFHDIQFIDVGEGRTPDLRASSEEGTVLLEVKTINKSDVDLRAMKSAKMQQVQVGLSSEFENKLDVCIRKARCQLFGYQCENVCRRIIFLIIDPDVNKVLDPQNEAILDALIEKRRQGNSDVQIVCEYLFCVPAFDSATDNSE